MVHRINRPAEQKSRRCDPKSTVSHRWSVRGERPRWLTMMPRSRPRVHSGGTIRLVRGQARVNRYQISMPEDCVPLPQVTHQGDRYRLVIEVVPDSLARCGAIYRSLHP